MYNRDCENFAKVCFQLYWGSPEYEDHASFQNLFMDRKTDGWNEEIWGTGNICFRYCCSRYRDVLAMAPGCNLTIHKTIHSIVPLHCSTLHPTNIKLLKNEDAMKQADWRKYIMKKMHDNWDIIRLPQCRHQYFDEYAVPTTTFSLWKAHNCLFILNINPC